MPLPALLLIVATLLPLAGCLALLAVGRRLGTPLAGYVATFFVCLSALCSGWAMMQWTAAGNYHGVPYGKAVAPINLTWAWLPISTDHHPNGFEQDHRGFLDFGIYLDSLTVALFVTITLAALLIHIFAVRSMRRDPRYARFFAYLSLACFSVLGLLLCGSLFHAVLFLELAGFAASLLIGFRLDQPTATAAAMRIFLVHRVGDVGLLLGLGMLVTYVGNLTLPDLWLLLGNAGGGGGPVALAGGAIMPTGVLTAAGVALFFGAAARCAQFPLHVWSADAAEGVAPAMSMVMALAVPLGGIYLIARIFPLLTPSARLLIAIVGATTLTMAALIACAQPGIKQVLAWGAASQLGLIVLAIGVGSWAGATFHLLAWTFVAVLLFLAAGSVIRASRGASELAQLGGLVRKMPVTAVTSALAILAACGAGWDGVGLSGFYSRGMILAHTGAFAALAVGAGCNRMYWALFVLPMLGTALTACYMTRWWMLTFAGAPRDRRTFDHAREVPTLYWPLVILAILTALAGRWLGVADMLESSIAEARHGVRLQADASDQYRGRNPIHVFDAAWTSDQQSATAADEQVRADEAVQAPAPEGLTVRGEELARRWSWRMIVLGLAAGILLFSGGGWLAERATRLPLMNALHAWLRDRMYFDELYGAMVVTLTIWAAELAAWLDRSIGAAPPRLLGRGARLAAVTPAISDRPTGKGIDGDRPRLPRMATGRMRMLVMLLLTAALVCTAVTMYILSI